MDQTKVTQKLANEAINNNQNGNHKDEYELPTINVSIPKNNNTWRGYQYSWYHVTIYLGVAISTMLAEYSIAIALVSQTLNIGTGYYAQMEETMFAVGLVLLPFGLKIGFERITETAYLKNPKSKIFRVTAISIATLTLVTVFVFGVVRYKSFTNLKTIEYISEIRQGATQKTLLMENMGASDQEIAAVHKSAQKSEIKLLRSADVSTLEELQIKFLKSRWLFWSYILIGVNFAVIAGVCLAISTLMYKVLRLRHRISRLYTILHRKIGEFHSNKDKYKRLIKLQATYNELLEQRATAITNRSVALSRIYFERGKTYSDTDWTYEKMDIRLALLEQLKQNK